MIYSLIFIRNNDDRCKQLVSLMNTQIKGNWITINLDTIDSCMYPSFVDTNKLPILLSNLFTNDTNDKNDTNDTNDKNDTNDTLQESQIIESTNVITYFNSYQMIHGSCGDRHTQESVSRDINNVKQLW